jgi:hypothetical protein
VRYAGKIALYTLQLTAMEEMLVVCGERLRFAAPNAAVRELRVRYWALARVVRRWFFSPPHAAQIAAMLECVLELNSRVQQECGCEGRVAVPRAADHRPLHTRTTRPPPPRSSDRNPSSSRR